MNQYNRKPNGKLEVCPHCGRDSGERKIGVHVPERYYVRCASCGFTLSGWSHSAATASWNRLSKNEGMKNKCCVGCKWHEEWTWACFNGDSPYCADFVNCGCPLYEEKKTNDKKGTDSL